MEKRNGVSGFCGFLLFFVFCGQVFAGGYDNSSIGSKAYAMASAFTGIADDASAVYYNPGGLVFQENNALNIQAYAHIYWPKMTYTANSIEDVSDHNYVIPGFFISKTYDKWAFGFGNYIPYAGGGGEYDNFQKSGYDIKGGAAFISIGPAIAYELSPKLAIGAGFSTYYGTMESDVIQTVRVKSSYDGIAGYGMNLGVLYKYSDDFNIGFDLRSEVPIKMDGDVKATGSKNDSEVEFTLPYYFTLGFGYKYTPKLTFSIDTTYMLWGSMDEMDFETAGRKIVKKTYYKNSWRTGLGMDYRINDTFAVRSGLKYVENATAKEGLNNSNDTTILIPSSCDVDMMVFPIGVAYNISRNKEIDVSGQYVRGVERTYVGKKFDQEHLILSLGFRFTY